MNKDFMRRDFLRHAAAVATACTGLHAIAASGSPQDPMPEQNCGELTAQDIVHLRRAIELSEFAATPE